jgi:hypothetical protein
MFIGPETASREGSLRKFQARGEINCICHRQWFTHSRLPNWPATDGLKLNKHDDSASLAAVMERDLLSKDQTSVSMQTVRSWAQKFQRQVEKAQKSLEANPDCGKWPAANNYLDRVLMPHIDLTDSLRKILDLNIDNFSRHWCKSYRDRMLRLY